MNGAAVVIAGTAGCLLSAAGTPLLGRLALRWGFVDRPGGYKTHGRPVPYLGGVAIMFATVAPFAVLAGLDDVRVTSIVLAAAAVALLGLIDDFSPLSPLVRLAVETVAAVGVVVGGVQAPLTGSWLDGPVTVLWIVVVTNSFNLLDNMDGALGTIAAIGAAFLSGAAFVHAHPALGLLLAALAHACLGFLLHNRPPAKVFMGDTGSLFIGFVISCSAALLVTGHGSGTAVAGLLLPTFLATVDTGTVFLARMLAPGRSPMTAGSDHVSHRLRHLGLGTGTVAAVLGAVTALAGSLCLALALGWVAPLVAAVVGVGTALVLIVLLRGVDVYASSEHPHTPPRTHERLR
ncbi:MraY family glycosyltransferase [Streptosporangium sp. NPDC048047]|uniref:glycosyltransferase family 4 protein n=1 Tax=Streptosporangium sp. NPDC048047 TaxID=3155748 RepID=UPI003419ED1C